MSRSVGGRDSRGREFLRRQLVIQVTSEFVDGGEVFHQLTEGDLNAEVLLENEKVVVSRIRVPRDGMLALLA